MKLTTNPSRARPIDTLLVRRLPARINAEETAILLGFATHDIPLFVKGKLHSQTLEQRRLPDARWVSVRLTEEICPAPPRGYACNFFLYRSK